MRLTRAALRAEATPSLLPNEPPDASKVPLPPSPSKERAPLSEVSANPLNEQPLPTKMAAAKKTKANSGRKGAKGKKGKKTEPEPEPESAEAEQVDVLQDARRAAASPASDAAVDELAKVGANGIVQVPMNDERPASPPSRAVRMTRRQLAMVEAQTPKPKQSFCPPSSESVQKSHEQVTSTEKTGQEETIANQTGPDTSQEESCAVTVEAAADVVNVPENQPETLQARLSPQPVNAEDLEPGTPSAEQSYKQGKTPTCSPSRSPARTPMRLEESIEAIDALEEAIEQVGKAIPLFDHETDERSPQKAQFNTRSGPAKRAKAGSCSAAKETQPKAAPRLSRNPVAPRSMKPAAGAIKPSRIRVPSASQPSLGRSLSSRAVPAKEPAAKGKTGLGEVPDYLGSKRRPISISFPAPPPPPKSTKPPTKCTFQLPGEAVAAKLKAQKQERLKREEEGTAKKANFKARPAPVRKVSVPVKQTAASKARESLLQGNKQSGDGNVGHAVPTQAPSRSSSLSSVSNSKRQSAVLASSRPPFTASISNRLMSAANPGPLTKSTVTAADVATQRVKAREIFNRDKIEKQQKETERKEKEEAAKRARAEAAERGRIASREWAEKQKLKKMGMAVAAVTAKAA